MSLTITNPTFKPISIANINGLTIHSNLSSLKVKSNLPFFSFHSKSTKLPNLSFSSLFSPLTPSWVSLKSKIFLSCRGPSLALVAQTSDWAQQEEEEEEEEEETQAAVSEWEGEGEGEDSGVDNEGGEEDEGEGEEGFSGEDDSYEMPPEDAKLFVGNLPYDMDSQSLAELFDQAGTVETAEVIYNRETDQSRGFGFVTMSTVEEGEKAVEMFHRYDVSGRLLTVNKAAPRGARVERPPRDFGSSFRIYVGNLPWGVDDARLEQVFSEYGKVLDARVVFDRETGRSRGFGFVTMSTKTELDDAIAALDGQSLDGRAIRVNVAEERPRRAMF